MPLTERLPGTRAIRALASLPSFRTGEAAQQSSCNDTIRLTRSVPPFKPQNSRSTSIKGGTDALTWWS
jgi:hypothetical protein